MAQLTQIAQASQTPQPELPTATATPTQEPATATATQVPPTATSVPPTSTPQSPTPTAIVIPCNWAKFVSDVTVKDGSVFTPGTTFTKTWRIKNIGTCTWSNSYAMIFSGGTQMGGPSAVNLPGSVKPGETVDLSVTLTAPDKENSYTGYWQLRDDKGVLFGIGADTTSSFWVKISVKKQSQVVYELADDLCDASWHSANTSSLPCPGKDTDTDTGFVYSNNAARLETGTKENEVALITFPNAGDGGYIAGTFPAFKVQSGDHFKAVIGCLENDAACNVMFQLNYTVDGGPLLNMGTWTEVYDKSLTKIDIDLSNLAGKNVKFVLTVLNNGSNGGDWAFWLRPRVIR